MAKDLKQFTYDELKKAYTEIVQHLKKEYNEAMTEGSESDILTQILQAIQELKASMAGSGEKPTLDNTQKSMKTPKPKFVGHDILKGDDSLTYQKISKMSWQQIHDANDNINESVY